MEKYNTKYVEAVVKPKDLEKLFQLWYESRKEFLTTKTYEGALYEAFAAGVEVVK